MISVILISCALVAITVSVQAAGLAVLARPLLRPGALRATGFWSVTWVLIRLTWALLLLHALEITVWAIFYWVSGCMPDAESAFYFSGVTYTTIGYGDLLLPEPWRILGPAQGQTGILMGGLSAALFVAVVRGIYMPAGNTEPG